MQRSPWRAPWTPSAWIGLSSPITWYSARTSMPTRIRQSVAPQVGASRQVPTATGWNPLSS